MQARNVEVAQTTDQSLLMLRVRMVVLVWRTMMTTMTMTLRTFFNNGCVIDITMLIYEDVSCENGLLTALFALQVVDPAVTDQVLCSNTNRALIAFKDAAF